jgi:hypothetical protein
MGNLEFYAFVVQFWGTYLCSLIFCLVTYYFIYRRVFLSLLDPLNFNIFFSCLGSSVVIFLFLIGEINLYYFSSFCFTQILFTLGFFVFKPIKLQKVDHLKRKEVKFEDELLFLEIMFIVSSLFNIISQLYVYSVRGIPLFMVSYLDTYNVGGGFGILMRIITASSVISWYLVIHFLINKRGKAIKVYVWGYMITSLICFSLNGSKATFLTIGLTLFLYTLINCRYNVVVQNLQRKIEKFSLKLFGVICVLILIVLSIQSAGETNPFLSLGIRLIHSGDAYFYGYPNDVLKSLPPGNGFNAVFSDLLGMLRVYGWDELPQAFGMTLVRFHYPALDVISGANARHNIFGLFYFGYFGSLVFSFILGITQSFCRNYLYSKVPNNTFIGLLYILLYFGVVTLESDIVLALFMLNSYVLGLLLILICTVILFFVYRTQIKKLVASTNEF